MSSQIFFQLSFSSELQSPFFSFEVQLEYSSHLVYCCC
jgi:hypothetical protein